MHNPFQEEDSKERPVAVLGGGVLGRRIACTWASAGHTVHIYDPSPQQLNAAIHYVESNVEAYAASISCSSPGEAIACPDLEPAVEDAWTVIEAVPEMLSAKVDIFARLVRITKDDCLLTTNSSSFKSAELLQKVGDVETIGKRVFNTHYMMPPDNRIVELMSSGYTDPAALSTYAEKLEECGLSPIIARKQSTGFVFNRIWAAVKREVLTVLAEGVSVPEEIDIVWQEMFADGKQGPCAMMDAVGLDTVALIEQHYVEERGLPTEKTLDFLNENYIKKGKLGAKSGKGGLYPAGHTTKHQRKDSGHHDSLHAPTLYYLDLGLNSASPTDSNGVFNQGKLLAQLAVSDSPPRVLVDNLVLPDGLDISMTANRIYWTNMNTPNENDGTIQSCCLDGRDVKTLLKPGDVHTPKQLIIDHDNEKLYFCDREGLKVMRCDMSGSNLETLIQTGDWKLAAHTNDTTRWCVGIAVNNRTGHFYWTQKGASKGNMGKILRAGIEMPEGASATSRDDVETILTGLPEPIDLEIDVEGDRLYWTDRGDPPAGNTINSIGVEGLGHVEDKKDNPEWKILAHNMHEAIGIKLDKKNRHIYATDIGGAIYRFNADDGKGKIRVHDVEDGSFSGIALAHV